MYPYSGQFPPWDSKDYDDAIILDNLREVLERPDMNENSVLILNLGLHYMESVRLQDYRILIMKVIDLLNERDKETGELKHKARVIWKTSTSFSKEKDTGSQLTSDRRRFLALPVSIDKWIQMLALATCFVLFFFVCSFVIVRGPCSPKLCTLVLLFWPGSFVECCVLIGHVGCYIPKENF